MYDYNICSEVYAETTEKGRKYFLPNGKSFPSITTILSETIPAFYLDRWRQKIGIEEANRITKEAADRGTLIHSYAERHINGEDIFPDLHKESEDVIKMSTNLIKVVDKNVSKVYASEIALWNEELKYAGRCDLVGEYEGEPALIDFKTSKRKKYNIKSYYIQCSAYALAHNIIFGSNIKKLVILITVENKDVQIFKGNLIHHLPDLKYNINKYYNSRS